MLAFIGKLCISIVVMFAVMFGLDKWWVKDNDFAQAGSDMMWISIMLSIIAGIVTFTLL